MVSCNWWKVPETSTIQLLEFLKILLDFQHQQIINSTTFDAFFTNVTSLFQRVGLDVTELYPCCVLNWDGTGILVVFNAGKLVAKVGTKQVHARKFADRDDNHILVPAASVDGRVARAVIIFEVQEYIQSFSKSLQKTSLFQTHYGNNWFGLDQQSAFGQAV